MLPPLLEIHEKVAPAVVDEPLKAIEVAVQVNTLSAPAFAFGEVASTVTNTTSVAVHPFNGLVTVNIYVPAAFTVGVAVVAPETMLPPLLAIHEKVTFTVVEEPLKAIEVAVQVNTLSAPAFAFGVLVFRVTNTTSVAVQPLIGSVTVNVYVPAAFTVGVPVVAPETMFPPLLASQAKVTPADVEEPLKAIDVTVQDNTLSIPALAFGAVLFKVTKTTSVIKHPLAGLVTVTVYVPAAFTSGVAVIAPETMFPPLLAIHEKVAPAVVDEPLKANEVTVQVNILSAPAFAFGTVLFNVTKTTSVAVHPLIGLVTVNVYVPAAFTVGVAVVLPETMFPPLLATHENVAPAVVDEPLKANVVTVQVNILSAPAFAFGVLPSRVITATSVAVHPFVGLVTVNV
jgi:hypothetical protein